MAATLGQLLQKKEKLDIDIKRCKATIQHHMRVVDNIERSMQGHAGDFSEGERKQMDKQIKAEKSLIEKFRKRLEKDLRDEKTTIAAIRKQGGRVHDRGEH